MQPVFHINAFASEPFHGDPATVVPLSAWLDDTAMQTIAAESGMTCAFFVGGDGRYDLRWFTPKTEIAGICGYGTLVAAGFVASEELGDRSDDIVFHVAAGELRVRRLDDHYILDLSALVPEPFDLPAQCRNAFGRVPQDVLGALDLIAVSANEQDVADFAPDLDALGALPLRAAIVTAPGDDTDFVLRWFALKHGNGEDTGFTGSAHCSLVPLWVDRLNKTKLKARQLSPRGATVDCELHGDRVWLSCSAVKYMQGELYL